ETIRIEEKRVDQYDGKRYDGGEQYARQQYCRQRYGGQQRYNQQYGGQVYGGKQYDLTRLPHDLNYWNIMNIANREVRCGRAVDDSILPPIPPLTGRECRLTATQILSPQYNSRSHTDNALRQFLTHNQRAQNESRRYLESLGVESNRHVVRPRKQPERRFSTETLVRYEKLPDRVRSVVQTVHR
ncbi:unnamed protein product, partial [Didymodactylos carnosus]